LMSINLEPTTIKSRSFIKISTTMMEVDVLVLLMLMQSNTFTLNFKPIMPAESFRFLISPTLKLK
jgi:hypothetical protein